ncbi:hypothetical protein ACFWYW_57065 [Nonomuraea sp. NPDC059023]
MRRLTVRRGGEHALPRRHPLRHLLGRLGAFAELARHPYVSTTVPPAS